MKKRNEIIEQVRAILEKAGFAVSGKTEVESVCFDIIARREDLIVIIKVLINIDSLKRETADELRALATTLGASPMIICRGSVSGRLERGSIYSRYLIPVMAKETLYDYLIENVPPYIFAAPGGFYVKLDGKMLDELRSNRNISLGTLAEVSGVSRRTIQLYCDGAGATIDVAMKIEEFLGVPLIMPLNPFAYTKSTVDALRAMDGVDALEKDIFAQLKELGYDVLPTARCPFDALTRDDNDILLTGVEYKNRNLVMKARTLHGISTVVGRDCVLFINEHKSSTENIEGSPVIGRDELLKLRDAEGVRVLIEARRKKAKTAGKL